MTKDEWRAYLLMARTEGSLSALHGRQGRLVEFCVLLASGLLGLGLVLPFMQINKLLIFSSSDSLIEIGIELIRGREYFLAAVVIVFSVIVPIVKLDTLYRIWTVKAASDPAIPRLVRWVDFFSKWSMLEIFIAAIFVFAIKASWLGSAMAETGLYCFAVAAMLTMMLTLKIKSAVGRYQSSAPVKPLHI
jgi:paraquat-inducible protein A